MRCNYRPDIHLAGEVAIQLTMQHWQNGNIPKLIVYPRGIWFMEPDDYIALFASLRSQPDYLSCRILGKPENDLVKDAQRPIDQRGVKRILGFPS